MTKRESQEILFKTVWSVSIVLAAVYAFKKKKKAVKFGCVSVRTCVEINFYSLLGMDDTLRPPVWPSVVDLTSTPPD